MTPTVIADQARNDVSMFLNNEVIDESNPL